MRGADTCTSRCGMSLPIKRATTFYPQPVGCWRCNRNRNAARNPRPYYSKRRLQPRPSGALHAQSNHRKARTSGSAPANGAPWHHANTGAPRSFVCRRCGVCTVQTFQAKRFKRLYRKLCTAAPASLLTRVRAPERVRARVHSRTSRSVHFSGVWSRRRAQRQLHGARAGVDMIRAASTWLLRVCDDSVRLRGQPRAASWRREVAHFEE